ncbi:hypothetical protein E7V35_18740, partial [Escherichia coli]|nr:hypothetical protein [Escherichia coli]
RNRSHWSTSKTPSYTKSVSWQHHLFVNSYFVMLLNFSCDGFKYHVVYSWGYCLFVKYGHFNRCPYKQSMILADY